MARMTQEQLDQLLAQNGGGRFVHSPTFDRTKLPNPAASPTLPDGSKNPAYVYGSPADEEYDVQQWKSPDGYIIQAVKLPDGSWEVIKNQPPTPSANAGNTSSGTPSVPAGSIPRIEGSPIPGRPDEFDNTQPIRAWHTPDGRIIYEPLTPAEVLDWQRQKNGGKTDAEVATANQAAAGASSSQPVPTHPGYTQHTTRRRNPTTGVDETETYYTDPQGNRVAGLPEKPAAVKTDLVTINGQQYQVRRTPGTNGQPDKIEWFDPAGKPLAQPPVAAGTPHVGTTTVNGQIYTTVTTINPDGSVKQEHRGPDGQPIAAIPKAGTVKLPPDAPVVDYTNADTAFQSYQKLFAYVNDKVMKGELSADEAKAALAGPHAQVGMLLDKQKEEKDRAETLRRDQLTERSQDMTQSSNRLSAANAASQTAIRQSSDLIEKAAGGSSTIVPLMVLQAGMGQAYGGFRESPNVAMDSGLFPGGRPQAPRPSDPATVGTGGNALGVGSVPGVMTPGTPTDAATLEAQRQQATAARNAAMAGAGVPPAGSPPATGAVPGTPGAAAPAPARPSVIEPPARANIPAQSGAPSGNERPDDIITVDIPGLGRETMSRAQYGLRLQRGSVKPEWVVNAEPAGAAQPNHRLAPASSGPASTTVTHGTGVQPYPGAPVNVPYPTNDGSQSMTSGGWTPVQAGQRDLMGAPSQMNAAPTGVYDGQGGMAPSQVLKSGMAYGANNIDDLSRQLLSEGYSIQEINEARERAKRRAGLVA